MRSYFKGFVEGIANIIYTPSIKIKRHSKKHFNDYDSLYSDWEKIGLDMRKAIEIYKKETFENR